MTTVCVEFCPKKLARDMKRTVLCLAAFIGAVALANCNNGCKPAQDPTTEEQSYTTQIIACAATAGYPGAYDRDADLRCRADVDCRFGLGPCYGGPDGGR